MADKKSIVIYLLIIFIICILLIMPFDLKKDKKDDTEKTIYGIVKENNKSFIVLEDTDTKEKVYVKRTMEAQEGDIVVIKYVDDINNCEYEIIGNNRDYTEPITSNTTTTTESRTISTTTSTTTTKTTKVVKNKKTSKIKTTSVAVIAKNEDELLTSIEKDVDNDIKEENQGKIKSTFIKLVDFIFYEGEIKGYTFKDLTDKGKAKVVYYALKVDGKIDDKWPGYKETISDKMKNIKTKLLAKYMEITTNTCTKHPSLCDALKSDFQLLKNTYSYTWDIIKNAFNEYIKPTGTNLIQKLKEWYQVYSGK